MKRSRGGFSISELAVALVVGSILTSIAFNTFQTASSAVSVRSARTMYATLQQRARARAVEMGETVLFFVDVAGDSAWIVSDGTVSDVTRFGGEMNVDLRAPTDYMMCMTPRGYADFHCGSAGGLITATTATALRLEFWQAADSTSVVVLPMGQLVGAR